MDFTLIPVSKNSLEWQCSILKFGGVTVLLNCGWTESLDVRLLEPLIPHLKDLDLILLTHADLKHLGAIPHLLSKYPVTCPVVCTEPVCRFGELVCVACLEDRDKYQEPTDDFEIDDVLRIFMSRLTPINYRETFNVSARGRLLAVCPHPAGGHLGSAYWTLHCGGLSAVYLVDCEVRSGRYLDGLELQRLLPPCRAASQHWDVVITSPLQGTDPPLSQHGLLHAPQEACVASKAMMVARTVQEQRLLEDTITTLRRGGTVLIPTDAAGWIPELLLLLEAAWAQDRQLATSYPLVWLSSMGDMILDQVKTRLEYMSRETLANFEVHFGQNPFVLRNVRIFQTLEELCATHPLSRPKVILSTSPYLEGGDSRELFFRLCGDPRTLLCLLGIPPGNTLARRLLDDFVLGHAVRKEYQLQHCFKHVLPDEQLRAYYEAKLQELAESNQKWMPPELAHLKLEEDPAGAAAVKQEALAALPGAAKPLALGSGAAAAVDAKGAAAAAPSEKAQLKEIKSGTGALWGPIGWPGSRTLAHSEARVEGDEYGHLLTPAELRVWRSQDQEGNKYSFPGGAGGAAGAGGDEGADAEPVKEEAAKIEDEQPPPVPEAAVSDWRTNLNIHFREPMRCEVRDRSVRVVCRIRYLPNSRLEPRDLCTLVKMAAPTHVVLLPAAKEATTGSVMAQYFSHSHREEGTSPPEIHALEAEHTSVQFRLRPRKRKVQFSPDIWPSLTFLKSEDGVRVARVQAALNHEAADPRLLELTTSSAGSAAAEGAEKAPAQGSAEQGERLPRGGALFLGNSQESLSLSGLKEQLLRAEWSRDYTEVEFKAPKEHAARPWSARVLAAGGKAMLGWVSGRQAGGDSENGNGASDTAAPKKAATRILRLEGMPGEEFFMARAALYKRCTII